MNTVILIGYLGSDAESRTIRNNSTLTVFSPSDQPCLERSRNRRTPVADHAAYLGHWLTVLKEDKRAIFSAAAHAQRAADFLSSLQPEKQEESAAA